MNSNLTRTIVGFSLLLIAAVLAPSSAGAWGGAGQTSGGNRSFSTRKANQPTIKLHTVGTTSKSAKFSSSKGNQGSLNKTTTLAANDKSGKDLSGKKNPSPDQGKDKHHRHHRRNRGVEAIADGGDDDVAAEVAAADDEAGNDEAATADSDTETESDASPATAETDSKTTADKATEKTAALPDLELLGVSLLDGGSSEELIGPKYRVVIRNNGKIAVSDEFTVTLSAANSDQVEDDLPFNSKVVRGIAAGQTLAVDIRLPFESMEMNTDKDGQTAAFSHLLVQVDSDNEIEETTKDNNDGAVERTQVPVEKSVARR